VALCAHAAREVARHVAHGIAAKSYDRWSKDFLEAGKKQLSGDKDET